MVTVLFLNSNGGGFASEVEVPKGTTISQFLQKHFSEVNDDGDTVVKNLNNFLIKVNRQVVAEDYVLLNGDRVTATPKKIEGA